MILDSIKNAGIYFNLNQNFKKAFEYLQNSNFENIQDGKYLIDEDNIFAIVNSYQTKDESKCNFEAHKRYIDLQFMVSGKESIGFAVLNDQKIIKQYDTEKDYMLFEGEKSYLTLNKNIFAIFFPTDIHMPGIKNVRSQNVRKVVVKIKV